MMVKKIIIRKIIYVFYAWIKFSYYLGTTELSYGGRKGMYYIL